MPLSVALDMRIEGTGMPGSHGRTVMMTVLPTENSRSIAIATHLERETPLRSITQTLH